MKKLNLNENFISRIWINPVYYDSLHTTDNKSVEIIDFGMKNDDSGADFLGARIRIDGIVYSGDVEIHRTFKDWGLHQHKKDRKYNSVILQVVFWGEDDRDKNIPPKAARSRNIHTVILSKFLSSSIHDIWKDIINNPSPGFRIPCYPGNKNISNEFKSEWLCELGRKRLKYRADRHKSRLEQLESTGYSPSYPGSRKTRWEKVLFEYICEALGFSKNKDPFLKLSAELDLLKIKKYCSSIRDYEAVIFGTAGFLYDLKFKSDYISGLKDTWKILREKLKFQEMDRAEWTFFRLRPRNFPSLRLAYAAALCMEINEKDFFRRIITAFRGEEKPKNFLLKSVKEILSGVNVSDYWKKHYDFGKESKVTLTAEKACIEPYPSHATLSRTRFGIISGSPSVFSLGAERILGIFVNVLIPIVYLYASEFEDADLKLKTEKIYSETKDGSTNKILKAMNKQLFFKQSTIAESQGLIHLHNFYCVKQNCAVCRIGRKFTGIPGTFEETRTEKSSLQNILKIIIY